MKIEEIKEARDEFIKVNEYILELANNQFSGLSLQARMKHDKFMRGVDELIEKLEQAEKALEKAIVQMANDHNELAMEFGYAEKINDSEAMRESQKALQAIRGNVATEKRGGLLNPDGGDYPLKWMSQNRED